MPTNTSRMGRGDWEKFFFIRAPQNSIDYKRFSKYYYINCLKTEWCELYLQSNYNYVEIHDEFYKYNILHFSLHLFNKNNKNLNSLKKKICYNSNRVFIEHYISHRYLILITTVPILLRIVFKTSKFQSFKNRKTWMLLWAKLLLYYN